MTLPEWTQQVTAELTREGFEVSDYKGFPLVKKPKSLDETMRLLKCEISLEASRQIYGEGMLFLPAVIKEVHEQARP